MLRLALALMLLAGPAVAGGAEQAVLAAVNAARAQKGCGALSLNAQLQAAAEGHARAMAVKNFFSHTGKDGRKFPARIAAQGYAYRQAAENIAAGQASAAEVMQSWMGSAGHRRNILNCALRETGIALVYQAEDKPLPGHKAALHYYWVEVFGAP